MKVTRRLCRVPARSAGKGFGPFTLFLVKSRRVAPGNFGGICLASVKFRTWVARYAPPMAELDAARNWARPSTPSFTSSQMPRPRFAGRVLFSLLAILVLFTSVSEARVRDLMRSTGANKIAIRVKPVMASGVKHQPDTKKKIANKPKVNRAPVTAWANCIRHLRPAKHCSSLRHALA